MNMQKIMKINADGNYEIGRASSLEAALEVVKWYDEELYYNSEVDYECDEDDEAEVVKEYITFDNVRVYELK